MSFKLTVNINNILSVGSVQCFCAPGYSGTGVGPMGCQPGGQSSLPGPLPPDPHQVTIFFVLQSLHS